MSMQPNSRRVPFGALTLNYPMSIGVFDTYPEAQKAIDTLSDAGFPVQNCLMVGTELRQFERVTGRLSWARVLLGGVLSGLWLGLFVGLIFSLFTTASAVGQILSTMAFGAVFGAVWAALGYAATRGTRDFTSVSQIVPSRFEVLAEHKVAHQAREILATAGISTGRPVWPAPSPVQGVPQPQPSEPSQPSHPSHPSQPSQPSQPPMD